MDMSADERSANRKRKAAIRGCWSTCRQIFDSGIFGSGNGGNALLQAAVIHLLINLNDLLQKAAADGVRIAFREHIPDDSGDVTDLVRNSRNAACHIGSSLRDADFGRFGFVSISGGSGTQIRFGDTFEVSCDFDDDIAFYFGPMRLYLRRHLLRALEEVGVALDVHSRL